jgi:rhodanese-related sulfurtransferase
VDYLIEQWYLIALALFSGALLAWPRLSQRNGAGGLSPSQAVSLFNREKANWLDVNDAAQFAAGHIASAKNLPLEQLKSAATTTPPGSLPQLPKNKTLPLIVVCATGAQSARAVNLLKKLGYEQAQALTGGLAAWREASLPIEKAN